MNAPIGVNSGTPLAIMIRTGFVNMLLDMWKPTLAALLPAILRITLAHRKSQWKLEAWLSSILS